MSNRVRTVFLSDSHLGQKLSRGDELLAFLRSYEPDYLYLVGDIIDAWCIRWSGHWPAEYTQIIERVFELRDRGTVVRYLPGNHDAFLRKPMPKMVGIQFANEFIHESADGRRWLVMHGDLMETIERRWSWLSRLGSFGFNRIIDLNLAINFGLRKLQMKPVYFCFTIKRASKWVLGAFGRFRRKLIKAATDQGLEGIICGHVHFPQIVHADGAIFINTGDWLEHASALVEHSDGTLELRNHGKVVDRVPALPATQPSAHVRPLEESAR